MRRWLKGAVLGGRLGASGVAGAKEMLGVGGAGGAGGNGGVDSVEVSFEWKRGRNDKWRKCGKPIARAVSRDVDCNRDRGGLWWESASQHCRTRIEQRGMGERGMERAAGNGTGNGEWNGERGAMHLDFNRIQWNAMFFHSKGNVFYKI
jgi:hypothetical protein